MTGCNPAHHRGHQTLLKSPRQHHHRAERVPTARPHQSLGAPVVTSSHQETTRPLKRCMQPFPPFSATRAAGVQEPRAFSGTHRYVPDGSSSERPERSARTLNNTLVPPGWRRLVDVGRCRGGPAHHPPRYRGWESWSVVPSHRVKVSPVSDRRLARPHSVVAGDIR